MPLLDNPRHEIFAQELAKGTSQKEAYVSAGYITTEMYRSKNAIRSPRRRGRVTSAAP